MPLRIFTPGIESFFIYRKRYIFHDHIISVRTHCVHLLRFLPVRSKRTASDPDGIPIISLKFGQLQQKGLNLDVPLLLNNIRRSDPGVVKDADR